MIPFSVDVFVIVGTALVGSAYASSRLFELLTRFDVPGGFYGRALSSSVLGVGAGLVATWLVVTVVNTVALGTGP